jgi:tellurite methyltransferase
VQPVSAIEAATPVGGRALLDVRDLADFEAGHLPGSGHIPLAELADRRAELPAREAPVLVVAADGAQAAAGAAELERLCYQCVAYLDAAIHDLDAGDRSPAARLWRPSPFLEEVLPLLPRGLTADLAAGAGREAVFLAMHGFEVEAWDHDREVLERAAGLARRHGVDLTTVTRNLERREPELPVERYRLVTVFRFLHRPLLPHIARALAPGGRLVYETYMRGQERFGRPRHPRFLLDPGELPRAFADLAVERYEELDPPQGPIIARLLARRAG